jgi:hypothetical protein
MEIQKAPACVPVHLKLIALTALLLSTSCSKSQPVQAKQDNAPLAVTAVPVKGRELRRTVQSVGTMFPFDETVVSAELEGRVVDVKADLGDVVPKGAVLVNISDEEQRYLLAQNEAALRMSLERVGLKDEHDRIKDVRETSEVRRAQADMVDAEQRYNRTKSLVDQGIGAQAVLSSLTTSPPSCSSTRRSSDVDRVPCPRLNCDMRIVANASSRSVWQQVGSPIRVSYKICVYLGLSAANTNVPSRKYHPHRSLSACCVASTSPCT